MRVNGIAQISRSSRRCRSRNAAARLAPPPLGDEIVASRREEEPVAVLDDRLQQLAAVVDARGSPAGVWSDSISDWCSWSSVSG